MACKCNLRKKLINKDIKLGTDDIYLDYCSTTKPDINILAKIEKINRLFWGNPSSQNSRGVYLFKKIEKYSNKLLQLLETKDYNIYFDSSSSSIIKQIYDNTKKQIVTSNIEHSSLLNNSHLQLPTNYNGEIDLNKIKEVITNNSIFIYSPVNHETGYIQNCKTIYETCKKLGATVILDCVQTISRLKASKWLKYCDGFYFSGHKIHSIPGAATIIVNNTVKLFKENETLPFSIYQGTINTPGIIGLLMAGINLINNFENEISYIKNLHNDALNIFNNINTEVINNSIHSAPGIINISLPNIDKIEDLLLHLNINRIYISRFSACTGDINIPSKILLNTKKDEKTSQKSLRISFGKHSKRNDFFKLVNSINEFIRL